MCRTLSQHLLVSESLFPLQKSLNAILEHFLLCFVTCKCKICLETVECNSPLLLGCGVSRTSSNISQETRFLLPRVCFWSVQGYFQVTKPRQNFSKTERLPFWPDMAHLRPRGVNKPYKELQWCCYLLLSIKIYELALTL